MDEFQALRSYLQTEFGLLHKELAELGQKLARDDDAVMSKDVFERRVSTTVQRLERSDSMVLSPTPRRLSFGLTTFALPRPATPVDDAEHIEVTSGDVEEETLEETQEIDDISKIELPGSVPAELNKSRSKKLEQASQRWAESIEDSNQKLNLFEHKVETVDAFGRGMGLVSGAEDLKNKAFSSKFHRRCYQVVTSSSFELLTIFLISSSALQIGLSTNWMAEHLVDKTSDVHRVIEVAYCVIFTAELTLRLVAYRLEFFTQVGWAWNVFDLLLVSVQLIEELLMALSGDGSVGALQQMSPTTLLRIARILRAVRVLRILRIALMAEDLRLLVSCLLYCSKPFFWTAVLLGLMIYIVAIYLTQIVLVYRVESDVGTQLKTFFPSVPTSMLSLFQGMTGGLDWENMVTPILEEISTVAGILLVLFMAFAIMGVLNVVTGTFVQNAICRAEEVKAMQRAMKARRLFKSLDDDETGQISFKEILNHTKDREVLAFFRDLDIEPSEAKFLFDMLDINQSGSIDFEEFLNGCIRLQGSAKAIDMLVVTRETRLAFEQLSGHMRRFQAELAIVTEKLMGWAGKKT